MVSDSRFSPVFVLVPWQDFSTLQININIYYVITNVCTTEWITNLRIDYSSNVSFTTWDVLTKSTCVHCTLVASDKYILVPLCTCTCDPWVWVWGGGCGCGEVGMGVGRWVWPGGCGCGEVGVGRWMWVWG